MHWFSGKVKYKQEETHAHLGNAIALVVEVPLDAHNASLQMFPEEPQDGGSVHLAVYNLHRIHFEPLHAGGVPSFLYITRQKEIAPKTVEVPFIRCHCVPSCKSPEQSQE